MGPLAGMRIVEFAGIGPGPMAAMVLSDLGAEVLRIERRVPYDVGLKRDIRFELTRRGRKSITLDLKNAEDLAMARDLVGRADALIEGFRPGAMERLGLGPEDCWSDNPGLVYGRMTGWGQDGPLAQVPGHDLNYIAITGAAAAIGRRNQPPTPPLNLVGDYGGGSLYLVVGILAALHEKQRSGQGQIVDASVVDGTLSLMTALFGAYAGGEVSLDRGTNILDSGAHFYDVYQCSDGAWVSVAPVEARFYETLVSTLELDPAALPPQMDRNGWQRAHALFAERFATKTQAEWCAIFEGSEACFAPVATLANAADHPHLKARAALIEVDGIVQPAPAPRFSRSILDDPTAPELAGASAREALRSWGVTADAVEAYVKRGSAETSRPQR